MSAAATAQADTRMHFADYLRGGAMLSVVFVHAMISFTTPGGWPVHDRQTSRVFDVLVLLEHVFAMPLFFAMSGVFSSLLCHKRGVSGFLGSACGGFCCRSRWPW